MSKELKGKITELVQEFVDGTSVILDNDLYDFADLVRDVTEAIAKDIERTEPYATESIREVREAGTVLDRHINLGVDVEEDE